MRFLDLLDRYKQRDQSSGIRVGQFGGKNAPLEEVDEAMLHRLLGLNEDR